MVGRKGAVCASFCLACSHAGALEDQQGCAGSWALCWGLASLGTGDSQGRVSSWRVELQLFLLAGLMERGSDFPQTSAGSRQKSGLPAPPAGVLLLLRPLPALHHETDYPRAEGHTQREGLAC